MLRSPGVVIGRRIALFWCFLVPSLSWGCESLTRPLALHEAEAVANSFLPQINSHIGVALAYTVLKSANFSARWLVEEIDEDLVIDMARRMNRAHRQRGVPFYVSGVGDATPPDATDLRLARIRGLIHVERERAMGIMRAYQELAVVVKTKQPSPMGVQAWRIEDALINQRRRFELCRSINTLRKDKALAEFWRKNTELLEQFLTSDWLHQKAKAYRHWLTVDVNAWQTGKISRSTFSDERRARSRAMTDLYEKRFSERVVVPLIKALGAEENGFPEYLGQIQFRFALNRRDLDLYD